LLLLLLLWWPLGTRTALLLRLPALLLLLLALAVALPLSLALRWLLGTFFLPRFLAGALLELAHLLVHVPRCLPLLLEAQLVMPAVRSASIPR
jgi:hypothetical protein